VGGFLGPLGIAAVREAITQARAIAARQAQRYAPVGADLSQFLTSEEYAALRHAMLTSPTNCSVADLVAMAARGKPVQAPLISIDELKTLLAARIVFDLGQFSPEAKRWLDKEVKARRVQRTWNCQRYREGKFMYWIAAE
jgi:hypothetical protein